MPGERAAEITLSVSLPEVRGVKLEGGKKEENIPDLFLDVLTGGNSRTFLNKL